MALKKVVSFKGYDAEYHRITEAREAYGSSKVDVEVALYKDAATREADAENVLTRTQYRLNIVDQTRESLYAALKELEEFTESEDC